MAMDMFFMLLCVLINGGTWHCNATMFPKKSSALEKAMWLIVEALSEDLCEGLMKGPDEKIFHELLDRKKKDILQICTHALSN